MQSRHGIQGTFLKRHFQHIFPELQILGNTDVTQILYLGMSHPFLLDAVLAVSASHLRCHAMNKQSSRSAEQFYQPLAARRFQELLSQTMDQQTADAALLTCMFLGVLAFSFLEDDNPMSSWMFRNDPERLNWLSLNLGLKPLLIATEAYRQNSILQWTYNASDDDQRTFYGEHRSLHRVPEHWVQFLGLGLDPSTGNILREPARMLAEIRLFEPRGEHFFLYINFIGALDLEFQFRGLLEHNDVRAIWLLGYWMGLMCRYDYWWMRVRASSEWRATCIWLNRLKFRETGREGQMWTKLMYDLGTAPKWQYTSTAVR
jgi:hypothetical protein